MTNIKVIVNDILIVCFFLVPIVIWKKHFHLFEALKEFIFASSVLISFGLFCTASILAGKVEVKKTRLTVAVTSYYIYSLISFLAFPYADRRYFFFFTCLILLFFTLSGGDILGRNKILHTVILVALLSSIYGCFQFFGIDFYSFGDYFGSKTKLGIRIFTTFGHPNLLGGFCVFSIPVITAFLIKTIQEKKRFISWYLGIVLTFSVFSLMMSQTRGAWLAVLFSFSILLTMRWGKSVSAVFTKHVLISGITAMTLIVCIFIGGSVIKKYTSLTDATSFKLRLTYYKNTFEMIREYPVFGRGIGTFNVYYPLYQDNRIMVRLGEPVRNYQVDHPHNEHLELLSDGGVVGYGLFLWIIVEALCLLSQRRTPIEIGLVSALLGLLCDGLLSQNLRSIVISSLLWMLIGFANIASEKQPDQNNAMPKRLTADKIISIVFVIIVIGVAVLFAYNLMDADYYLKGGLQCYALNLHQSAIQWLQQALALDPYNKIALYGIASVYRTVYDQNHAIEYYTKLLRLEPNFPEVNFYLGKLYFEKHELNQAKAYFEKQIRGNNMYWEAYNHLALIEIAQGNKSQAIRALKEIITIREFGGEQGVDDDNFLRMKKMLSQLYSENSLF